MPMRELAPMCVPLFSFLLNLEIAQVLWRVSVFAPVFGFAFANETLYQRNLVSEKEGVELRGSWQGVEGLRMSL